MIIPYLPSSIILLYAGNFTVNLTNVPTTTEKAYSIALILNQGATGYLPNAFSIDSGAPITINWSNGAVPVLMQVRLTS